MPKNAGKDHCWKRFLLHSRGRRRYAVRDRTEIKIGNTNACRALASACSVIDKLETAFFKMVNDQGGVAVRKINFITLDDGYSPPKTLEQVRMLIEEDQVALLFNTLGTATN